MNRNDPSKAPDAAVVDQPRTMISYTTKRTINTVVPGSHTILPLYENAAYTINDYSSISQMISNNSAYLGIQNYAKIDGELVYIKAILNGLDGQSVDANYVLYSLKDGETEPVVIDTGVQNIQCSSNNAVYYRKTEGDTVVQYQYSNGEIIPVSTFIDADFSIITDCSEDGKVFGFLAVDAAEDGSFVAKNGYSYDGTIHWFESPNANVHGISKDGKRIYVTEVDSQATLANIMMVSDLETGALETIAESVSELMIYEDTGSAVCIGNIDSTAEAQNPVGQLIYVNGADGSVHTVADNVTALVEAADKSYAWLNEQSKEMVVTEQTALYSIPTAAKEGQFHYVDADGNLCAADLDGKTFTIYEGFYKPEEYTYGDGLFYLTHKDNAFYWAVEDQVYRYEIGSMTAPQTVTLEDQLANKLDAETQMGYLLDGDGSVLEQEGNTLVLKAFDQQSTAVYDSPNPLSVVGLNNEGDKVYFITSDNNLYEKEIKTNANPKQLASNVQSAVTVEEGLYLLCDFTEDNGGTLKFLAYNGKDTVDIVKGVYALGDLVIQ